MQNAETKKIKWARSLALIVIVATAPFVVLYFALQMQYKKAAVVIHATTIQVQRAVTTEQKTRGLCCRESLPQNSGMLFVYDKPGNHRFWMKDTKISLDMYWLDANKKVVHIERNVQPSSYPQTYGTDTPSQYVLETNAGFAKAHNIQIGDQAQFQN